MTGSVQHRRRIRRPPPAALGAIPRSALASSAASTSTRPANVSIATP
jgi:hypothetical protein